MRGRRDSDIGFSDGSSPFVSDLSEPDLSQSDLSAAGSSGSGADAAIASLFAEHYLTMVRIAALLTRDSGRAEELVQDAFVDLHQRWALLREPSKAVGYLRTSVVNRARSELRHSKVVQAHRPAPAPDAASAEVGALARVEQQQIIATLDTLPARQRAVLILRYYGQLSEAEIAETLGISRGAVKSHSSRGLRTLRPILEASS